VLTLGRWPFVALALLHVAGALRRHFALRNTVLARMIPALAPNA
jgi:cytochrome b561